MCTNEQKWYLTEKWNTIGIIGYRQYFIGFFIRSHLHSIGMESVQKNVWVFFLEAKLFYEFVCRSFTITQSVTVSGVTVFFLFWPITQQYSFTRCFILPTHFYINKLLLGYIADFLSSILSISFYVYFFVCLFSAMNRLYL